MLNEFPEIVTERLNLRRFLPADVAHVHRGLADPRVNQHYGVCCRTIEESQIQVNWLTSQQENGTGVWWAICRRRDNEFVGAAGLNNVVHVHGKAEVGCWLLPEFWGQGYMAESMTHILNYGFEVLRLHRIEGFVETGNARCRKSLARIGFIHEGQLRDCEKKDEKFISLDVYSILASEYSAARHQSELAIR